MIVLVADYVAKIAAAAGHRDFVLWPMPAYHDAARNRLPASPSPGFGITSSAKDPEGAKALLKLIIEPEMPNSRVQQTHNSVVQRVFSGAATVDQALRRMDEAYRTG